MRTRDVPCPSPQAKPIEPAFLVPLPSFSEAMRVVTAARWSGSEACRKPSARLTSSTTQRAGGPCKKASSQPSIVAIPSPFSKTGSPWPASIFWRLVYACAANLDHKQHKIRQVSLAARQHLSKSAIQLVGCRLVVIADGWRHECADVTFCEIALVGRFWVESDVVDGGPLGRAAVGLALGCCPL